MAEWVFISDCEYVKVRLAVGYQTLSVNGLLHHGKNINSRRNTPSGTRIFHPTASLLFADRDERSFSQFRSDIWSARRASHLLLAFRPWPNGYRFKVFNLENSITFHMVNVIKIFLLCNSSHLYIGLVVRITLPRLKRNSLLMLMIYEARLRYNDEKTGNPRLIVHN